MNFVFEKNNGYVSKINGVGPVTAKKLKKFGVITLVHLLEHQDLKDLARLTGISLSLLERFKLKAESLVKNEIYQINPFCVPEGKKIYLDIESCMNSEFVWLIGALVGTEYKQFYAETLEQEREILKRFLDFLDLHPTAKLMSFSGTNYDIVVLSKAIKRHELDLARLTARKHVDVYTLIKRSFIFPKASYGLKDLGKIFGYDFKQTHSQTHLNGFVVSLLYEAHLKSGVALDKELFEYNDDDVKVIPFIIKQLQENKEIIKKDFKLA